MANANAQEPKSKYQYDIYDRIFKFVISVLNHIKTLPKTQQNIVLIDQILDLLLPWAQMPKKLMALGQEKIELINLL